MSRWTPCKRREFIRRLGLLGFDGPLSGTRHPFMVSEDNRLAIFDDFSAGKYCWKSGIGFGLHNVLTLTHIGSRMDSPPEDIAYRDEEQPRKACRQRNAKSWHPPRGNEHGAEGCGAKERAPRTERAEAHY